MRRQTEPEQRGRGAWLVFTDVDLHCDTNNSAHHTSEVTIKELIVRRGQPFTITVKLSEPFQDSTPFLIKTTTGEQPSEEKGTMSHLSIPSSSVSPLAKAVWKLELDKTSSPFTGVLVLSITPPAVAPIGQYFMVATYKEEEMILAVPTVLFNPWCPEDSVFLADEELKQEYVMNEHGKMYRGSKDFIGDMDWDFGQFEDNMVSICMKMLDLSHKHKDDPANDVANRSDPAYVGRIVSAMTNSQNEKGVLEGQWGGSYSDGHRPTHWTGSSAILTEWQKSSFQPVKYGQCWVFAGVMCSVARFLGIPCRVITNFSSAHDSNANLTIDRYHSEEGVVMMASRDSIWNFHVWVEGWMKRPDLSVTGKYDGWQVLDPTPQELSDGVFCCGPASKAAIFDGHTNLEYDVPFVFSEVNADCVDWMIRPDGSLEKAEADTEKVGKAISTKAVGSDDRSDVTNTYKHKEGTVAERFVFARAIIRHYDNLREIREKERKEREARGNVEPVGYGLPEETPEEMPEETPEEMPDETPDEAADETPEIIQPPPKVLLRFEEVSQPMNGKDVSLNLLLSSASTADRPLYIFISVQAMKYDGNPEGTIKAEKKEETLLPGNELKIPILVPFTMYSKPMLECDSMKISALVKDKENPDHPYLGEHDIVLLNPPINVKFTSDAKVGTLTSAEVTFSNTVNETLTNCSMTISGSGLCKAEYQVQLGDLLQSRRIRVRFPILPYKAGVRTLLVDFDCSVFRDIKGSCTVTVKP
ncbi:LOW QUALITY PROTEIN: protein-glutamine gamma-glutamyltransferase 5-like [Xyrichtys novacula]|uniref:protein-glutamine gamma-glutamyltransferase n=1 Tax=Xyrichtys novacula TaxID=13765 RepID=A0AAV1EQ13_XYRNO|nr:LOW QUALITY PROTEIN: protein-glutamine gamma-glutamyltransferase 5-like [Xyrichtys novacula]